MRGGDACVALGRPIAHSAPRHAEESSPATTLSCGVLSCLAVAHRLARATQASPRRVHTTPAPTRLPCAHRLLKRPQHQPTRLPCAHRLLKRPHHQPTPESRPAWVTCVAPARATSTLTPNHSNPAYTPHTAKFGCVIAPSAADATSARYLAKTPLV